MRTVASAQRWGCRLLLHGECNSGFSTRRTVYDTDGYELPFGKSKADRERETRRAQQASSGVKVVLARSGSSRQVPQWHPASRRRLQSLQSLRTVGGGGDDERIEAAARQQQNEEEEEEDFTSLAEHAVELRRARMANMRLLLEGVPLIDTPRDPFKGFFSRRDGRPESSGEGELVTVQEVEDMLHELSLMRFPAADEEELHLQGCEEYYGVGDMGHAEDAAAAGIASTKAKHKNRRRSADDERGLRAPFVSDEIERKLLICLCLQTLTRRLTTNDRQRPLSQRSTTIDRFGRSPPVNPTDARNSPALYMRYGLDDSGTDAAFRILDTILEAEAEQHYEAIRYHAELAVVSGQLWRLADSIKHAKGFINMDGTPRSDSHRDPDVREASQLVCEDIIAGTVSEYLLRHVAEHIDVGDGEGAAAKALLDLLKDICYITGHRASRTLIETLVDDVESGMSSAMELQGSVSSTTSPTQVALRGGASATDRLRLILLQSSSAILKTLIGTELPLVVDPSGVLQFDCESKLYFSLREQKRLHESWGAAERLLGFYDQYRGLLAEDYAQQVRSFEQQIRDETGLEASVGPAPVNLLAAVAPEADGSVRVQIGDAPDYENPYAEHMRRIWIEYCSDRARESPTFGKKLIRKSINERYPNSNELYRLLAACHFKLGEKAEAMEAVTRAIELNACDPHGHLLMAALLWDEGRFVEARREQRLADIVEQLVFDGKPVTAEDLKLAHSTLAAIDDRRVEQQKAEAEQLHELDGESHKFFIKDRAEQRDALAVPDTEYTAALLPPLVGALVRDLASIKDDDGDGELQEWKARMAQSHRYSKFFAVPRVATRYLLHVERDTVNSDIRYKNNMIPDALIEPHPPKRY